MIYNFWLQEPYKTFLINWQKTIEWRLNKWKFKKIKNWDILLMETWEKFEVLSINMYKTFYEMIKNEWIENIIPDKKTIEEWVEIYYKFYTKEMEKEFWVVWILVKFLET